MSKEIFYKNVELAETDFLQSIEGTIKDCKEKVHKNNLRRPDNKMKGHE